MIDPQPLKGKAAIVTGAGGGIGRVTGHTLNIDGGWIPRT